MKKNKKLCCESKIVFEIVKNLILIAEGEVSGKNRRGTGAGSIIYSAPVFKVSEFNEHKQFDRKCVLL